MSQQPKTETDRLSNVIQVLQLGQKTGRLIVERTDGSRFEQGTITFVNGQVVQANVNQQEGPEALDWLKSWGRCRFTFANEQRSGQTNHTMPSIPPQAPQIARRETSFGRSFTSPLRSTTGSLPPSQPQQDLSHRSPGNSGRLPYPGQNGPQRFPDNSGRLPYPPLTGSPQSMDNSGKLPYPPQNGSPQSMDNSGKLPYPPQNGSQPATGNPSRTLYPPRDFPQQSVNNPSRALYPAQEGPRQSMVNSNRLPSPPRDISRQATGNLNGQRSSTAWLATPYRSRHIDDGMRLIEQMGLSRTHRRLFLLIDGRRSIKELMRLMAHEPVEILKLLQDLEGAGVIQV
jgi:hypothetical protein